MQRTLCHLVLGNFPVILIGGFLQDWCLSICPDSARAAHPRLQENIWRTDLCLLLIHQLEAPDISNCAADFPDANATCLASNSSYDHCN